MMAARKTMPDWTDRLPSVRGRLTTNAPLKRYSWFRTGGPADILFEPADEADLQVFLTHADPHIPVNIIGVGSNLLVRDGGVEGVVIRLGKAFSHIQIDGMHVTAGAGATDIAVANRAAKVGVAGLEFLRGIPGTIGGAVRMNAGAYGAEMADIFCYADIIDRAGTRHRLEKADLAFSYRRSSLPPDAVVVSVGLQGFTATKEKIAEKMGAITQERESTQPVRMRTGGSTFKNPEGCRAWQLIDQAGCRGMRIGDAQISEKHANFIINLGTASAAEIEALGEAVRKRVKEHSGIDLEWEIRRLGRPAVGGAP